MAAGFAHGQDGRKVPISFLPPPLENATYSLGIYEAKSGKLVRRLQEIASESAFTVGLNGLMTNWDGKDDEGKAAAPGRYAALGYAVGAMKVEGVGIHGNDWAENNADLRVKHIEAIALVPSDNGLGVIASMADGSVRMACFGGAKGQLRWLSKPLDPPARKSASSQPPVYNLRVLGTTEELLVNDSNVFRVSDGQRPANVLLSYLTSSHTDSDGEDGTRWQIQNGRLNQYANPSKSYDILRQLAPNKGDPVPIAVSAAQTSDRLYLLEEAEGWQRVRGLSWVETKEENGKPVSTWQTFFERNIRLTDGPMVTEGIHAVVISLVENPLEPGKPHNAKLAARKDEKGSYLASADGLRLRKISEGPNIGIALLQKGTMEGHLTLLQSDGAAWDEFSIEGAKNMMEFDAGEIEMTADGEKVHPKKAAEPPNL